MGKVGVFFGPDGPSRVSRHGRMPRQRSPLSLAAWMEDVKQLPCLGNLGNARYGAAKNRASQLARIARHTRGRLENLPHGNRVSSHPLWRLSCP